MKESDKLEKIAGTLKHGAFSGENRKRIFITYGVFAGVFSLGMILGIVVISMEQATNPNSIAVFIFALIGIIIGISATPIILLFIILKNEKIRKEILLWIEDAVELQAYSKTVGAFWNPAAIVSTAKIQVDFEFDGKKYSHSSENKAVGLETGYGRIWVKYADRKINILYSPKYDEVLVLKDKN